MTSAIKSRMSKPSPRALITSAVLFVGVLLATLLLPSILQDLGYAQGPVEAKKFAIDYPENSTVSVAQFTATDPEGQPIRWELSGDDAADFSISEGRLTFSVSPDFENPADRNRDNIYEVTVEARDPGFNIAPADVTVTVLNVDEPGTVTLSSQQPEEGVRVIAELADPDRVTSQAQWQWSRSSDGLIGWTTISGATASNYTPAEVDVGSYLRATATYTDAQGGDDSKIAHGVSENPVLAEPHINRAPEFLDRNPERIVNENAAADAPVGDPVTAEDPDDDPLTYTLGGADVDSFDINPSNGQISVPADTDLDFETRSSYSVTLTATDPSAARDIVSVTITVADVNEPPDVTEGEIDLEYAENGTEAVEQFVAVDPEGQDVDWRLSGDDISDFSITGGSLTFNSPPDFEAPSDFGSNNVYDVTVGASDPGGRLTWIDVTVTVTNVDEAGTVTLSTDRPGEGIPLNAQLTDPDRISSTIRWQWARSADADGSSGWADIGGSSSGIYTPVALDVGYYLQATASYEDAESLTEAKIARDVTGNAVLARPEINQAPEFLDRSPERSVNENADSGDAVGDPVAAEDANGDTLAYVISGTDAESFDIDEDTGQISVGADTSLNFETKDSYQVSVMASDPDGESDMVSVVINVSDVDEPPTYTLYEAEVSYAENGTGSVGTFTAVDPEGEDVGWELSGDDADLFSVSGGVLSFISSPNFEGPADENIDNVYDLTIGASDPADNLTEVDVTVTVTNVDEAGTVTLSSGQPVEGVRLTAILADPDGRSSNIRWQWARSSDGSTGWMDIDEANSGIYTPVSADADHYLRATARYEDRESDTVTKTANAATDDPVEGIPYVNRAPTFFDVDPTTRTVNENSAVAAAVGDPVDAEDLDDDVLVYVLSGDDADLFDVIAATGQVTVGEGTSLNFEARRNYQVTLTVSDPSGASDTIDVNIDVTDVDEPPEIDITVPGPEREDAAFQENSTSPVATYTVGGQTEDFVWSLSGIDAANFSISSSGVLTFNEPPDYENPTDQDLNNQYMINVNATDTEGKTGTSPVAVTVTDVNETIAGTAERYDLNDDDTIDRGEALSAIRDYFNDIITKNQVLTVIMRYFIG